MKILIVVSGLNTGGAQRVASNMAVGLPDDCEIDILLNDKEEICYPYKGRIIDLGMKPQKDKSKLSYQGIVFIKRLIKMRKLKKTERYDAAFSFLDSANIANIITGNKYCKTIVSVHSRLSASSFDWRYKYIVFPLIRLFYKYADSVVAVSHGVEEDLRNKIGYKGKNLVTIYNGFDIEGIREKASEEIAEEHKKLFDEHPTLIAVGRLTKAKGYWHLIKAMKIVAKKIPDARLIILGEGEQEEDLRELCNNLDLNNNIYFLGFLNNPFSYIQRADTFVISSIFEGLPSSLIEALILGKPCVATDFDSGAREILAPQMSSQEELDNTYIKAEYGILAPVCSDIIDFAPNSVSQEERILADAIVDMMSNMNLKKEYSSKAQDYVKQFSIGEMIEQWWALI